MTRYEWETIRQEEMNEMRQRQIRLGKRRQRGRDEAFMGFVFIIFAAAFVVLAEFTDIGDTAFVLFAIISFIRGLPAVINGVKNWIK